MIILRNGNIGLGLIWKSLPVAALLVVAVFARTSPAQTEAPSPYYSRVNTFGFLAAYSNDSSHILMGVAENRKLLNLGATYSRRLFQDHIVNWQYNAEILPVALESDPVDHEVTVFTSPFSDTFVNDSATVFACHPNSGSFSDTIDGVTTTYTYTNTCKRQWTIGEGISPVGFQWNFLPRRKVQPVFIAHGGYMYSTHPIPIAESGSFNFTFDFGVGIEMYRSKTHSIRADYRFHHISDHDTTNVNPGVDNGIFQITYAFGR